MVGRARAPRLRFLASLGGANAELAAKVAWYFLQIYDPEVDHVLAPPGTDWRGCTWRGSG